MDSAHSAVLHYATLPDYPYDGHWITGFYCDIRNVDGTP